MENYKSRDKIYFLIFAIITFCFLSFLSFHYEYSADSSFYVYFRGIINNQPIDTFYIYMQYWDRLLIYLYKICPSQPWYGYLLLIYSIANYLLLQIILYKVLINGVNFFVSLLFSAIINTICIGFLFYIGFSRIPFLTAGLVWIYVIIKGRGLSFWSLTILTILLCGACFMRYESVLGAVVALIPSLLFVFMNKKGEFKAIACRLILVFSIPFIAIWFHNHLLYHDDNSEKALKFYDLHFSFFDASQRATPASIEDSIRIEAMAMDFNADKVQLGIYDYERLVTGSPLNILNKEIINTKIKSFQTGITHLYNDNTYFIYLYALLFIITLFVGYRDKKNLSILILSFLWIISINIAITFLLKGANRVAQPILSLGIMYFLLFFYYAKLSNHYTKSPVTLLLFTFISLISITKVYSKHQDLKYNIQELNSNNLETLNKLKEIHRNEQKSIIFTNDALELFSANLTKEWKKEDLSVNIFDNHINYLPGGEEGIRNFCGDTTLIGFYNFIEKDKDQYLIVATHSRIQMLNDYFRILYQYNFEAIDITERYPNLFINEEKKNKLYLFQLDKFHPL